MALNPNISLAVKGIELPDPLDIRAKGMVIQQAQQEQEATNALNRAYAEAYDPQTGNIDVNRLRQSIATGGYGSKLPAVEKQLGEVQTQRLTQQKTQSEILDARLKQSRMFLEGVSPDDPNAANEYVQWIAANFKDPFIGPAIQARGVTLEQSMERVQRMLSQPNGLAQLIQESKLGTEKFIESNRAQLNTVNLGDRVVQSVFRPGTGQLTPIATHQQGMTPYQQGSLGVQRQNANLRAQEIALKRGEGGGAEGVPSDVYVPPPKEKAKLDAAFPKVKQSLQKAESEIDNQIADLKQLRNSPGLTYVTGPIASRTPTFSAEGNKALALHEKIIAGSGFQALQDLKQSSPTGASGLGSTSNLELTALQQSASGLNLRMDADDYRGAIDKYIQRLESSKSRLREGFDETYAYRLGGGTPTAAPDQRSQALQWARQNPTDPRAAQILQRLGVK